MKRNALSLVIWILLFPMPLYFGVGAFAAILAGANVLVAERDEMLLALGLLSGGAFCLFLSGKLTQLAWRRVKVLLIRGIEVFDQGLVVYRPGANLTMTWEQITSARLDKGVAHVVFVGGHRFSLPTDDAFRQILKEKAHALR